MNLACVRIQIGLLITALVSFCFYASYITASEVQSTPSTSYLKNIRRVSFVGAKNGEAYFSPDGKSIVFQGVREGALKNPFYQIYQMGLDTGHVKRISNGHGRTTCSYVHPKKDRMIFASTHLDPNTAKVQQDELKLIKKGTKRRYQWNFDPMMDIFETDLDGSKSTQLTNAKGYDAECGYSPDGQKIVFCSFRDDDGEIYTMDADGQNQKRLTHVKGYDGGPFFSSDGKSIVWRRFSTDDKTAEIWLMNADGSNQRAITKIGAMSWAPFFHPSGKWIAFACNQDDMAFEIYAIRPDGSQLIRLTHSDGFDSLPVFSPDGRQMMWTSTRDHDGSHLYFAEVQLPGITNEELKKTPSHQAIKEAALTALLKTLEGTPIGVNPKSGLFNKLHATAQALTSTNIFPLGIVQKNGKDDVENYVLTKPGSKHKIIAGALASKGATWDSLQADKTTKALLIWIHLPASNPKPKDQSTNIDFTSAAVLISIAKQMDGVAKFRGIKQPIVFMLHAGPDQDPEMKNWAKELIKTLEKSIQISQAIYLDLAKHATKNAHLFSSGSIHDWRTLAELLSAANPQLRISINDERNKSKTANTSGYDELLHAFSKNKIPLLIISNRDAKMNSTKFKPKLQPIANLALGGVYRLATGVISPTFGAKDLVIAASHRKLYLGTKPMYQGDGTGVVLRGVYGNSPAARAGLKAGDKVIELGGKTVTDPNNYLTALESLKANKATKIIIFRDTKKHILRIIPEIR